MSENQIIFFFWYSFLAQNFIKIYYITYAYSKRICIALFAKLKSRKF